MFDALRFLWYNKNITLRRNVFSRPQLQPLETLRNRVKVIFDLGMRATEVCALRLRDVDREQGIVSVRGKGATVRRLTLGHEGLRHLLTYLDGYRLGAAACGARTDEDHLFLSEAGRPLTKSGITLLFDRLRTRAGITRKGVGPALLRESFAMRYLQTGGDLGTLWELLGQKESTSLQHYLQMGEWRTKSGRGVEGMSHSTQADA